MKEQIKKTLNQQKIGFIATWALPLFAVVLGECEIFPEGLYTGDAQMDYILHTIGILLTVTLIPFALRIFNLNLVKRIQELPLQQARNRLCKQGLRIPLFRLRELGGIPPAG